MRKEFFAEVLSPFSRALGIIFGVVAVVGIGVDLLNNPPSDERTVETVLFVACVIWALSAISGWKKRNIEPPLLIAIDDSGLWLQRVGELMRWSEIESVKISYWGEVSCTIKCRHDSIRLHYPDSYGDRDGKLWTKLRVYKEIRSHWEQHRAIAT